MRLHETCAGDLLKTEFSFTPIKKKEKELKENREKAREDARKNRVSEKIPVSGKELGLYLYEKYKADEPDPLGLSDLEKKLENKEKELKRAGDPRVMEAYAGLSEISDALNALNMMASTAAYHNMKRILNANTLGGRMEEICEEAGLLKEKLEGNQPENLPSLLKNAKNLSAEYQSLIYNAGIADFQQKLGKNIP